VEQKREPSYYFNSLSLEEQRKMYPRAFGSVLFNMYQNLNTFVNEMRATRFVFYTNRYYIYRGDTVVFKPPHLDDTSHEDIGTATAMLAFFHIIPLIVETDDHVQQFMRIKEKTEDRVEIEVFPQDEDDSP
jgi:hypothetical protein